MSKLLGTFLAIFAATLALSAVALGANPNQPNPVSKASSFYPLTITVQEAFARRGGNISYIITVANTDSKRHFAPIVFIDPMATLANSTQPLISAFNANYGMQNKVWAVGLLRPGAIKRLVVSFATTVHYSWTDPVTGQTASGSYELGNGLAPYFSLYDSLYKRYTYAGVASPAYDFGK